MKSLKMLKDPGLWSDMLIIWGISMGLTTIWGLVSLGELTFLFIKLGVIISIITIMINVAVYKKKGLL